MRLEINIPENSQEAQFLVSIVIHDHISPEEAVRRILRQTAIKVAEAASQPTDETTDLDEAMARVRAEHPTYASFFGAAKGQPGAHGSPEAADRYIEELRNAW